MTSMFWQDIHGFLCASLLIRELPKAEYIVAKMSFHGYSCEETWIRYLNLTISPTAVRLRELIINPPDYFFFGHAICNGRRKCHKHVQNDHRTVGVLSKLLEGTTDSIVEILAHERPEYLLTLREMEYFNIFAEGSGKKAFPFFKFIKYGDHYAIPQLLSTDDIKICTAYLQESYDAEYPDSYSYKSYEYD